MNVFISWSGERSKCLAEVLRHWLKQLINALDPWISVADIGNGTRWRDHVAARLKTSDIGIICLTPGNLRSEWLLFEAGALSKAIETAYVCPLLIDLEPSDISGPLAQFQATRANREEIKKLVWTINSALGLNARPDHELLEAFEVWWPKLEFQLKHLPPETDASRPHRPDRELLEEILATVRDQSRSPAPMPSPETKSEASLDSDSFEMNLCRALDQLPGVARAKVEAFPDYYGVKIEAEPSLATNPKFFKFSWDTEPLNSTGERAIDKVAAHIAELRSDRAARQTSYANEDTPDLARFRKELLNELRRRKLRFSADVVERCRMEIVENRLVLRTAKLHLLSVRDSQFQSIALRVYQALFDRVPALDVEQITMAAPVQE